MPTATPGQTEPLPCKKEPKKLNNKQGTENEHRKERVQQRGEGSVSTLEKGGRGKS
jgi:hypothetical protein